jgi:MFS family permease
MMAGSLIGGYLQDNCGRRASLCVGSMLSAVAVALCFVSDLPDSIDSRRGMFLGGKLVQGCATGMMLCVAQTYMSEVLPTTLRGPILAFFPVFTLLGQLIGAVVVHICSTSKFPDSYRIAFASQWPLVGVLLVVAAFLPESPSWLMRRNRSDKALRSQQRLGIAELDQRPIDERMGIPNDSREQMEGSNAASYMDCFKGTHRRRTFIIAFASSLPQPFGLTLLSNASYFLQMVGMDANDSTVFLILGIGLGFISNIVSVWALSAGGRRFLSLMTLGIATVLWLAMGVAACFSGAVVTWYVSVAREREKMKTRKYSY